MQGVGYRYAMVDAALDAGIAGWVRNRRDGSVEAFVQGTADAVARVVAWAERGPPAARVVHVGATDAEIDAALKDFRSR